MQSKRIENETVNNGGELGKITENLMNQLPKNAIMLNKSLLPSKGLFYKGDIYIQKMSAKDVKNLTTIKEENVNGVMNGIISRCITGISVNDIIVADKIWLIFYLRTITYNDYPYQIKYTCEECQRPGLHNVVFKDLVVNYIDDTKEYKIKFDDGDELEIGFPTIGNEAQCNQIKKNTEMYVEPIDDELLDLSCNIKAVNNEKMTIMKAYEYLIGMDAIKFTKFANYLADINFGVKPYLNITCSCGNVNKVPLQFTPEFFMPKIV